MAPRILKFEGIPGKTFTITHPEDQASPQSFGSKPGKVSLNDLPLDITDWSHDSIEGPLPADALPGPVTLNTADTTPARHDSQQFTGGFGTKNPDGTWEFSPEQTDAQKAAQAKDDEEAKRKASTKATAAGHGKDHAAGQHDREKQSE